MIREPHRTEYINKLYNEKNVEWLNKEKEIINRVIKSYANNLLSIFDLIEKKRYEQAINYEKEVREQIEKYLFNLKK